MSKMFLQRVLLIVGVVGLLVVLIDLGISIAATFPGTTPARVDHVTAGPYHLTVDLYSNPAASVKPVNKRRSLRAPMMPCAGLFRP